jgi:hypothetical protein
VLARFSRVDTSRARNDGGRVKTRRALAKAVDLFAFAGFLSLGVRWFESPWAGFAMAAAYLLCSDALGMSAKNWFALGVIDVNSGRRCSLASSILRNSPWVAAPLFRTALVTFHDGAAPTLAYDVARGVVGVIGLAVAVTLWRGLGGDGTGRHWADELAGTKVLSLKPGEAVRPRPARDMPRKPTAKSATSGDRDAPDFDDADDADDARKRQKPSRPGRDRDAVDFDDAN